MVNVVMVIFRFVFVIFYFVMVIFYFVPVGANYIRPFRSFVSLFPFVSYDIRSNVIRPYRSLYFVPTQLIINN